MIPPTDQEGSHDHVVNFTIGESAKCILRRVDDWLATQLVTGIEQHSYAGRTAKLLD